MCDRCKQLKLLQDVIGAEDTPLAKEIKSHNVQISIRRHNLVNILADMFNLIKPAVTDDFAEKSMMDMLTDHLFNDRDTQIAEHYAKDLLPLIVKRAKEREEGALRALMQLSADKDPN